MESKRRHEKIKIQTEIKDLDMYIKADNITISRLKTSGSNVEFNKRQVEKLFIKIKEREEKLVLLKERLNNVITGVLDEELISQSKNVQEEIQRKTDEKLKQKAELAASKKVDKEKSQAFYQSNLKSMRQERRNVKDVNRSYLYYKKKCASIPEYMRKKLASMPENKGYIWKGVHCYGERPAERNRPISLSERPRGGETLLIHEWYPNEYRLYKKIGKGPKTLTATEPRNN
jgi:hypothetical protein